MNKSTINFRQVHDKDKDEIAHHSSCINNVSCKMNFSKSYCFVMSVLNSGIIAADMRSEHDKKTCEVANQG